MVFTTPRGETFVSKGSDSIMYAVLSFIVCKSNHLFFFSIMIDFPSIRAISSSFGSKGNELSVTNPLGKLIVCLDPTLYIFTFVSFTMYIPKYAFPYIKIYIHTMIYTMICYYVNDNH